MNHNLEKYLIFSFFFVGLFAITFFSINFVKDKTTNLVASVFFQNSIDTKDIIKKFKQATSKNAKRKDPKVKVMIVPGHDEVNFGTSFNSVKEADLNLSVALKLQKMLEKESGLEVFMTRDEKGYSSEFADFIIESFEDIKDFTNEKKAIMNELISSGKIKSNIAVHHNFAKPEVASILYGVNKYSNDNDFDINIHIHFNDYPGRRGSSGKYSGFAIYVPESQYSNSEASYDLAKKIKDQLEVSFAISDLPKEGAIVEDQELIAIGSYNTSNAVAVLIEYGYIYESQFTDPELRDVVLEELALQTYLGLINYLENNSSNIKKQTFKYLSNYNFPAEIKFDERGLDVLALQVFLKDSNFYPYLNTLNQCPLNGVFKECTRQALLKFQESKNVPLSGYLDERTRELVNSLNYL